MLLQVCLSSKLENLLILHVLYSESLNDFTLYMYSMVFVVSGEACGLAMGLVMLGSKSATAIEEMVGVS